MQKEFPGKHNTAKMVHFDETLTVVAGNKKPGQIIDLPGKCFSNKSLVTLL